jgi:Putative auto-transporter adhesin, head GIN domain
MRRIAIPLLALLVVVGCGGGPRVTKQRDVAAFDRLEVSGNIEVDVVPGDSGRVAVTGGTDVVDQVRTDVSGGVLHLHIVDHGT